MKLEVVCYAGMKADERPVRFRLDGKEYLVEDILDQWYGPEKAFYKVRADDGNLYILSRQTSMPDGLWDRIFPAIVRKVITRVQKAFSK